MERSDGRKQTRASLGRNVPSWVGKVRSDGKAQSVAVFSLVFAWVLSFPFEGTLLYQLSDHHGLPASGVALTSIVFHFGGLLAGACLFQTGKKVHQVMRWLLTLCLAATGCAFSPWRMLFLVALHAGAFASGMFVAQWGHLFQRHTPAGSRIRTAADVLICSNVLMILNNAVTTFLSVWWGVCFSFLLLAGAFLMTKAGGRGWLRASAMEPARTDDRPDPPPSTVPSRTTPPDRGCFRLRFLSRPVGKPLLFLCGFIALLTINSGLMYQVVNPSYSHLSVLSTWYWALPYIVAIWIMRNLPGSMKRSYLLLVAISMMGISFVLFMVLDRSWASYLLVDGLMLGACGIFDLFWWSILGEMLTETRPASLIFGLGLSSNVLGVLLGGAIGSSLLLLGVEENLFSLLAMGIVFMVLILLPLLNNSLVRVMGQHVYLDPVLPVAANAQGPQAGVHPGTPVPSRGTDSPAMERYPDACGEDVTPASQGDAPSLPPGGLTPREEEIVGMLLKGWSYRMVAQALNVSDNTVKTHVRNSYSKLDVRSKSELMRRYQA